MRVLKDCPKEVPEPSNTGSTSTDVGVQLVQEATRMAFQLSNMPASRRKYTVEDNKIAGRILYHLLNESYTDSGKDNMARHINSCEGDLDRLRTLALYFQSTLLKLCECFYVETTR